MYYYFVLQMLFQCNFSFATQNCHQNSYSILLLHYRLQNGILDSGMMYVYCMSGLLYVQQKIYPSNDCPQLVYEDGQTASNVVHTMYVYITFCIDLGALGVAMVQLSDIFHFHKDAFEGAKMSDAISLAIFMWIVEYLHEIGSK